MYIKKYWGNFIGGSDDSLNLMAFLEDQKQEEIPLSEIFAKIGLDKQNWDFRQTVEYLEFTHSDGVEMDFHFAIDVVTDFRIWTSTTPPPAVSASLLRRRSTRPWTRPWRTLSMPRWNTTSAR